MTPADAIIPPLRDDIQVKRYGNRLVIEDTIRRVRVPIDDLTLRVMQHVADEATTPERLVGELEEDPSEVWRRVRFLTDHLALATPRAQAQVALHQAEAEELWDRAALADAPLRYPEELRHGCVACGACCHGTDVGPLKEDDVARVRDIDWSAHLPGVDVKEHIVVTTDHLGREVSLMGSRHGRCVFLDDDKLCIIHKVAGPAHKPTICRQFPYTFTRTPTGIDVSYSMECRAWWQAKQHGQPIETEESDIRALIGEGGPVLDAPVVVAVWTGLDIDHGAWLGLRQELLDGVRAARSVPQLARALVRPVRGILARALPADDPGEAYVRPPAWGASEPALGAAALTERFTEACHGLHGALVGGFAELGDRFRAAGRHAEADRAQRLADAVGALLSGRRTDDLLRWEHETEVWRDMALAALYAHEPARRGAVCDGIARLVLRLLAGSLLAGMTAEMALRGRTSEQDVVDAQVLLTKTLRGSAFEAVLNKARRPLAEVFIGNAEAFAADQAPRQPHTCFSG